MQESPFLRGQAKKCIPAYLSFLIALPGAFSSSTAITPKAEGQNDWGICNNFLTRGFSSILESAAIIVFLSVSLMPAHSTPAQKVALLPWFKATSGLAATPAQWRHCGPRLLLVVEKTKTRSNLWNLAQTTGRQSPWLPWVPVQEEEMGEPWETAQKEGHCETPRDYLALPDKRGNSFSAGKKPLNLQENVLRDIVCEHDPLEN